MFAYLYDEENIYIAYKTGSLTNYKQYDNKNGFVRDNYDYHTNFDQSDYDCVLKYDAQEFK